MAGATVGGFTDVLAGICGVLQLPFTDLLAGADCGAFDPMFTPLCEKYIISSRAGVPAMTLRYLR